jgi:FtsZ-interacting cell division protein ZipA
MMLNARTYEIVLAVFAAAVLLHGLWRSRGEGKQDAIRESGPIL